MDTEQLIEASEQGDVAAIETLLAAGANVNTHRINGETGLMRAAAMGHSAAVEMLLAHGAAIDAWRQDGWTALALAAFFGHVEVCKLLLRAGANSHLVDDDGFTAAKWAEARGHVEILEVLQSPAAATSINGPVTPAPLWQRLNQLKVTPAGPTRGLTERPVAVGTLRIEQQGAAVVSKQAFGWTAAASHLVTKPKAGSASERFGQLAKQPTAHSFDRTRRDALRARTRIGKHKRAAQTSRVAGPQETSPRPGKLMHQDLSSAPAQHTPIVLNSELQPEPQGSSRPHRRASARIVGRVLLWLAAYSCTVYLGARIFKLDVGVSRFVTTSVGQSRPTLPSAVQLNTSPAVADSARATTAPMPTMLVADHKLAGLAPKELGHAPTERLMSRPSSTTMANLPDVRAANKVQRNIKAVQLYADTNPESSGSAHANTEPRLISVAQSNEPSKMKSGGAKAGQSNKIESPRGERVGARFIMPLPPVAGDPPARPPTKKVIPWP